MQSDRIRVKKSRFFGARVPAGQLVTAYNGSGSYDATGQEFLPPLVLDGKLYIGTVSTGATLDGGGRPRAPCATFWGALGNLPINVTSPSDGYPTNDPGNYLWGLARPVLRHAIVRGHAWSSAYSDFASAGARRHLVRLDTQGVVQRFSATGTQVGYVTPAYGLDAFNRVVFAQGTLDTLVTFTIGTDGTATYEADRAIGFGASPVGIGAVVMAPSGAKALVFGRDIQNRNQIAQTTDGVAYTTLPEAVISAGNPIRICDALSLPSAGTKPATVLALGMLNGDSGAARLLRSTDDGVNFTLMALGTSTSTVTTARLDYVNGVVFVFLNSHWYYSLDHGASWVQGSASVVQASRVDYDALRRCWIMHLRIGAVAVLENDLTYKSTVVIPSSESMELQFVTAVSTDFGATVVPQFNAPGFMCSTNYIDGKIYGIARVNPYGNSNVSTFVYSFDLIVLRLPTQERASVLLKGAGAAGDALAYGYGDSGLVIYPILGGYVKTPGGATAIGGLAVAAAGSVLIPSDGAGGAILNYGVADRAAGAAGILLDDNSYGGGGAISGSAGGSGGATFLLGGAAGAERRCETEPGALLVIMVGSGGRLEQRIRGSIGSAIKLLKVPISRGQDGVVRVEWEEWA